MTVQEAKKEYNKLIKRFDKAEEYFERKDVSQEEKEKFLPHFQEIIKGLNNLLSKIEVYTEQERVGGFRGIEWK